MSTKYTIDDFDRKTAAMRDGTSTTQDERYRHMQLSRKHVQARLKAILDAPAVVNLYNPATKQLESHSMPTLEAMTHKLVEMVLGQGEFSSVKDGNRIQAYKAVHDRVYGAPKQTIEHTQAEATQDETAELGPEALKELEAAMENALKSDVKALG